MKPSYDVLIAVLPPTPPHTLNHTPSLILWDVRQLCIYVDAHSVYCTLSEILHDADDKLPFASHMVQVLNMILFTANELYDLRVQLNDLSKPVCHGYSNYNNNEGEGEAKVVSKA